MMKPTTISCTPCWHWKKGRCGYGDKCNFYHGPLPKTKPIATDPLSDPCVRVPQRAVPCGQKRQPSNTTSNCWAVAPKIASDTEPDFVNFPKLDGSAIKTSTKKHQMMDATAKKKAEKEALVKAEEEHQKAEDDVDDGFLPTRLQHELSDCRVDKCSSKKVSFSCFVSIIDVDGSKTHLRILAGSEKDEYSEAEEKKEEEEEEKEEEEEECLKAEEEHLREEMCKMTDDIMKSMQNLTFNRPHGDKELTSELIERIGYMKDWCQSEMEALIGCQHVDTDDEFDY